MDINPVFSILIRNTSIKVPDIEVPPIITAAYDAGIPLIIMDSNVNTDKKHCFIGTDNYELGCKLAQLANQNISSYDCFGIIGHSSGSATAIERKQGLLDNIIDSESRMVDIAYCDCELEIARKQTIDMLTENPQIRCMIGLNESSSLGISTALEQLNLSGIVKLIACDSSQEQIKYMENGTVQAAVIQNPFNIGYLSIQTAVQIIEGEHPDSVINTGCVIITRDDMNKQENEKLLFPFVE